MKPRQPRKGVRRAPRRDVTHTDANEQQGDLLESQPEGQSVNDTSEDMQPILSTTDSSVDGAVIHEIPKVQEPMSQNENVSSSTIVDVVSSPKDLATQTVAEQAVEALAENVVKTISDESVPTQHHELASTPDITNPSTEAISQPAAPRETREPRQHPQNNNRPSSRQNHQHNNAARQHHQPRQQTSNRHEQLDFEAALRELETIVVQMEGSSLSLQDSLAAYQRGSRLVQQCQHWLSDAEQQVQVLENNMLSSSGEF